MPHSLARSLILTATSLSPLPSFLFQWCESCPIGDCVIRQWCASCPNGSKLLACILPRWGLCDPPMPPAPMGQNCWCTSCPNGDLWVREAKLLHEPCPNGDLWVREAKLLHEPCPNGDLWVREAKLLHEPCPNGDLWVREAKLLHGPCPNGDFWIHVWLKQNLTTLQPGTFGSSNRGRGVGIYGGVKWGSNPLVAAKP